MGRAIVRNPKAFLMDEPLSNLDAKLRVRMQISLAQLQKQLGITTVYVTHEQTEAMRLGDRVVVMHHGQVQQVDAPQLLYEQPVNLFVAGFIGSPAMNFLPARLEDCALRCVLGDLQLSDQMRHTLEAARAPRDVIMGVRPEQFEDAALVTSGCEHNPVTFTAQVEMLQTMGSEKYAHFALRQQKQPTELIISAIAADVPDGDHLIVRLPAASRVRQGQAARLWFDPNRAHIFDPFDGRNLTMGHRVQNRRDVARRAGSVQPNIGIGTEALG
jgi:multiple sugar transport system ATP-binding protein